MKVQNIVCIVVVGCIFALLGFHFSLRPSRSGVETSHKSKSVDDVVQLMRVMRAQNETIANLIEVLEEKHPAMTALLETIKQKDHEISKLSNQIDTLLSEKLDSKQPAISSPLGSFDLQPTGLQLDRECEWRYGLTLIEEWKKKEEIWCETDSGAEMKSSLRCFPYHQQHKKLDHRGPDVFCEARNFFIDFAKVSGNAGQRKPHLGDQYLDFERGSLFSPCKPTESYKRHMFMPHQQLQMNSFVAETDIPSGSFESIDTPTYLLARDEDCENAFHSTADFMNMYVVLTALELRPEDLQVVLFDKHTDGPYHELITKAFSPNNPLRRHNSYNRKKVLFKRLIFHLESPAGLIFPKVSRPDPMRCYSASLFEAYRKFVLQAFNLWSVPAPAIPSVTLTLRHRTSEKNVGRVMANEREVVSVLEAGNMMTLHVVDFATMSFYEQLKLIRSTNVLVGIHGAGLMLIMFAAEEAVLVEIHPSYRQDRHFRHAARLTGKIYMPIRSLKRETCEGTSDNVVVPLEEFKTTIDGALRIARNFDDGLSECGLLCPPSVLALDERLDPHYQTSKGEFKGVSVNTQFPC